MEKIVQPNTDGLVLFCSGVSGLAFVLSLLLLFLKVLILEVRISADEVQN